MNTLSPVETLAAELMTPSKSGVYMTRNELLVLARLSDASLRFNERKRMLADIFKSTKDGQEFAALVSRVQDFWRLNVSAYETLAATYPRTAGLWTVWIDKARKTLRALDDVKAELNL